MPTDPLRRGIFTFVPQQHHSSEYGLVQAAQGGHNHGNQAQEGSAGRHLVQM